MAITGPFVSPERFAVHYTFDWTRKANGERVQLDEVAVYTVVDGRIAREEFLYAQKLMGGRSGNADAHIQVEVPRADVRRPGASRRGLEQRLNAGQHRDRGELGHGLLQRPRRQPPHRPF